MGAPGNIVAEIRGVFKSGGPKQGSGGQWGARGPTRKGKKKWEKIFKMGAPGNIVAEIWGVFKFWGRLGKGPSFSIAPLGDFLDPPLVW